MPILRLVLAIIVGIVIGGVVNMALIKVGGYVIGPPAGMDMTTHEGMHHSMALLGPRHFIFPFLAHAVGTLIGAFVAVKIAEQHKLLAALLVGTLFFVGGVSMARVIPAPTWFIAADLIIAYFPAAWLGFILANNNKEKAA